MYISQFFFCLPTSFASHCSKSDLRHGTYKWTVEIASNGKGYHFNTHVNYEARKTRDRINQRITPERISSLSLTVRRRAGEVWFAWIIHSTDLVLCLFADRYSAGTIPRETVVDAGGWMLSITHEEKRVRAVDYSARSVRQPSPWVSGRTSGNPPRSSLRFTNDRRVSTVVTSWRMTSMCNVRLNSCVEGTKRLQSAGLDRSFIYRRLGLAAVWQFS